MGVGARLRHASTAAGPASSHPAAGGSRPAQLQFTRRDGSLAGDGSAYKMPDPAIIVFCYNRCAHCTPTGEGTGI